MKRKGYLLIVLLAITMISLLAIVPQVLASGSDDVTTSDILSLVEDLHDDGQIANESAARALTMHLTAVNHYEQQEETDKVVEHMNSFKVLLNHQLDNELMTEEAYQALKSNTNALIEKLDSIVIVKDGQAQAVVVSPEIDMEIDNTVPGWSLWNDTGSNGYVQPAPDFAHTGNHSVSFHDMTFGSIAQLVPAQPGPFKLSAYYFSPEEENSTINITLNLRNENNVVVKRIRSEEILTAESAGEWAKITLQGEISEPFSRYQVVITIKGQQDVPVYIDDVQFYQGDQNNNIIYNSGFEEIVLNHPVLGWDTWNDSGSNGYAKPVLGHAHTGKTSVSFHNMTFGSLTQLVQAQPGSFELSAYYFTPEKENSTINITLNLRNENNVIIQRIRSNEILTADTAGEWTKIVLQGDIPEGIASHQVVITIKGQRNIPVYVDDLLFTQGDPNHNLLENPGFEKILEHNLAEVLVDYVKKSTGVELPIMSIQELQVQPFEGTKIYIGQNNTIEDFHIDEALHDLKDEGFFIHPHDDDITIAGPTNAGTQNGVYEFLERYVGVRWLLPGDAWEDVPQRSELRVPRNDVLEEPAFNLRRIYDAEKNWTLANKLQFSSAEYRLEVPDDQFRFMHNLYTLFPVDIYAETHPEFYPNGRPPAHPRSQWQPCFTADGTVDVAVSGILDYFEQNPDVPYFSLGVNDTGGYCEMNPNHPHYPGKMNSIGKVHMSEIYYAWVNEVVERVLEVYPDKRFGVLAYQQVMDPPSFPLHPSVIPVVTKDRLSWIDEEIRDIGHEQLDAWYEVAREVALYDYMYGTFYASPRVYPHQMAENIQFAYEKQVFGTHAEMRFNVGDGPKAWLFAKLQWNPNQDVDALLSEWYERAVGQEAASDLAAYFDLWEEFWTERIKDTTWFNAKRMGKWDTYLSITDAAYLNLVTDEDLAESKRLLTSVSAKAQTPQQKERANQLLRMFEYYEASALSYPRQVDPPEDASEALVLLDHFSNGEAFLQKRFDLIEEFDDEPALKFHRQLRVDWTGWNGFIFWALVDYMKKEEASGGLVTDRVIELVENSEDSNIRDAAQMLLKVSNGILPTITENHSYEEGHEDAPPWIFWDPNNRATIKRVENMAHTGEASVYFEGAERSGTYQTLDIEPGFLATRVHYYSSPGTESEGGVRIVASPESANGTTLVEYISPTIPLSETAGEWASVGLFENIPEEINGQKVARVLLNAQVLNAPDAQVYVDDVVLYQDE